MGRRKYTPAEKDLAASRRALAKIEALDPIVFPTWREGMIRHFQQRVAYLEELVATQRAK